MTDRIWALVGLHGKGAGEGVIISRFPAEVMGGVLFAEIGNNKTRSRFQNRTGRKFKVVSRTLRSGTQEKKLDSK